MWLRVSSAVSFGILFVSLAFLSKSHARTCESLFAPSLGGRIANALVNHPVSRDILIHQPIIGAKIKAQVLKHETQISPKPTTDSKTWKYWQLRVAGDEMIAVFKDRRLDPIFMTWLDRTPITKDSTAGQLKRIEQLRQYTYLSLSNNFSPDTPGRDGELARMLGGDGFFYPDNPAPMRYFRLGDFLKIGRGICRHSAVALMALLHEEGLDAEYVTGEVRIDGTINPHAWVVVKNALGENYLLDAALYLDEIVRVDSPESYVMGTTDMGQKIVEYLPRPDLYSGAMRPIDRHDDHLRFFKRK